MRHYLQINVCTDEIIMPLCFLPMLLARLVYVCVCVCVCVFLCCGIMQVQLLPNQKSLVHQSLKQPRTRQKVSFRLRNFFFSPVSSTTFVHHH